MPEECQICLTGPSEWVADDLEGHIRAEHGENEASVQAMYDDRFDHLFDGTGDGGRETPPPGRRQQPTSDLRDDVIGKKWYMIGVGGAGNNILDAILMRRDTLLGDNDDRALIWEGGLAGYGLLNTNIAEMDKTYYATVEKGYTRNDLVANTMIGFEKHDYSGMGRRWSNGSRVAEADFEGESNPFRDRWDMSIQGIQGAQALMLIHSVTKGTGCGATPVLADKIRSELLSEDAIIGKPMLSAVVIPSEGEHRSEIGGRSKTNGVVGLSRIAQAVDAIIPFNNTELEKASNDITPRIDRIEDYNPPEFAQLNRPLVSFIEAFTMSSIPQFADDDAPMSIRGSVFDVADSFRPVEDKYPAAIPREEQPAVVLAPALGRLRASSGQIGESKLETLALNTLDRNRLADFDPSTAWGGNFMLYGPKEKMEKVEPFVRDGRLREIICGEQFLDTDDRAGVETVDVQLNQLVTPYLDDLYMWATLWNPEMPSLSRMYDHAKQLKEKGETRQAENVRDIWDQVEALFEHLGRENMS